MKESKKNSGRRRYLDDFTRNAAGELVYTGRYVSFAKGEKKLKQELLIYWLLSIAAFAPLIAAGCITAPGMTKCFYVIIPYAAALFLSAGCLWALFSLGKPEGADVREYIYEKSMKVLPVRALLGAACSLLCIICESIYIIINGTEGRISGCIILYCCLIVSCAAPAIIRKRAAVCGWERKPDSSAAPNTDCSSSISE